MTATTIDSGLFRRVLRRHAAAVVVVTAPGEPPTGFTATSFTSVSLDPPLVSFCVAKAASVWPTVRGAGLVAVHVLTAGQEPVARIFAASGTQTVRRTRGRRRHLDPRPRRRPPPRRRPRGAHLRGRQPRRGRRPRHRRRLAGARHPPRRQHRDAAGVPRRHVHGPGPRPPLLAGRLRERREVLHGGASRVVVVRGRVVDVGGENRRHPTKTVAGPVVSAVRRRYAGSQTSAATRRKLPPRIAVTASGG